jgi:carboxymethylenebutenolidase
MGASNKAGNGRQRAVTGAAVLIAAIVAGAAYFRPLPSIAALVSPDIHAEYVKYLSGKDTITAYLAYPERPTAAPGVIVIHEIFGMSDFVRLTTEQLAKDGFVAIAPDLLSRRGGTSAMGDTVRKVFASLPQDSVTADLDATEAYLKTLKAVRANAIGVIGFCWGGGQSFRYATNNPRLKAFVVCYGPSPKPEEIARIRAKGLGVYAENDARINAGLTDMAAAVKQAGKDYQYAVYPGVGHGFIRAREKPEVSDSAWRNVIQFFRAQLETK